MAFRSGRPTSSGMYVPNLPSNSHRDKKRRYLVLQRPGHGSEQRPDEKPARRRRWWPLGR